MKNAGFTLIEVLVAFIILAIAYSALLYLHTLDLRTLIRSENLFAGVLKLELFLAGEPIEGVEVKSRRFKVHNFTVREEIYQLTEGNEKIYFRLYRK